jgi:hypothetical protein
MEDDIHALEGSGERIGSIERGFDEFDRFAREPAPVAASAHDAAHLDAAFQQCIHQVASNKAGCARDQSSHLRLGSLDGFSSEVLQEVVSGDNPQQMPELRQHDCGMLPEDVDPALDARVGIHDG